MNGEIRRRRINNIEKTRMFSVCEKSEEREVKKDMPLVAESCKCSGFTMMAVATSVLMFVGIIIYALIV